ncbi:MAG: ZIP zinc transporter-domain-containing protein [Olpidium bornovanus]|uniref:ZIP zinc transporter-domain-containing protein n=1 Tax=Olpidium bornovanus TaxID=278681 RepID=A0A8H7ZU57_9FUNG|nr:MAG: ZIP zinc transporter-domain-containing protein [Olpidium bornovanus]
MATTKVCPRRKAAALWPALAAVALLLLLLPAACVGAPHAGGHEHASHDGPCGCHGHAHGADLADPENTAATELSPGMQWLAAAVANVVVTLCALTGALAMPFLRKENGNASRVFITFAVSLAVGSLLGDAVLHLIPEALGVHSHADHSHDYSHAKHVHDHSHDHSHDHLRHLWISAVTFVGAYSFFVFEKVLHHIFALKAQRESRLSEKPKPGSVKPVVWLILIGDGLHNFVDGLAIAVAFMKSCEGGLQTSLAVLLHEIPHELGDFAVLLSSGLSVPKALLFNCLSNVPAFLGSVLALTMLPKSESAQNWILAYTAGNFLYIALVDLLPSLFGGGGHGHSHSHGHDDHDHGPHFIDGNTNRETCCSTRADPGKAVADGAVVTDAGRVTGEGIFRESTKDEGHTVLATHFGILSGFAAMVGLALLEASQH